MSSESSTSIFGTRKVSKESSTTMLPAVAVPNSERMFAAVVNMRRMSELRRSTMIRGR